MLRISVVTIAVLLVAGPAALAQLPPQPPPAQFQTPLDACMTETGFEPPRAYANHMHSHGVYSGTPPPMRGRRC